MPIWLLRNPSSSGKATSESPSLLFLSFIIMLFSYTVYCFALHSLPPRSYCSVFSPSLCSYRLSLYFNSDFVLFFLLLFFPSLPRRLAVPRFLSLGEFWIREAFWSQTATILHVNKKGWLEAQWELHRNIFFS